MLLPPLLTTWRRTLCCVTRVIDLGAAVTASFATFRGSRLASHLLPNRRLRMPCGALWWLLKTGLASSTLFTLSYWPMDCFFYLSKKEACGKTSAFLFAESINRPGLAMHISCKLCAFHTFFFFCSVLASSDSFARAIRQHSRKFRFAPAFCVVTKFSPLFLKRAVRTARKSTVIKTINKGGIFLHFDTLWLA